MEVKVVVDQKKNYNVVELYAACRSLIKAIISNSRITEIFFHEDYIGRREYAIFKIHDFLDKKVYLAVACITTPSQTPIVIKIFEYSEELKKKLMSKDYVASLFS